MISINATLFVQVFHFLVILFILNRLMLRPIMRQISEREEHMKKMKVDSEKIAADAEQLAEKRSAIVSEARKKAMHERSQLKYDAFYAAEELFEESRQEVHRIRERANAQAQEQIENAKKALGQEAAMLADEITERVVGRRISL